VNGFFKIPERALQNVIQIGFKSRYIDKIVNSICILSAKYLVSDR